VLKNTYRKRKCVNKDIDYSSKYKSLLNSDTWGNDVLHEVNISSQILDGNIRETDYMDIQKDNILEHTYFMPNVCNWCEPSGICDRLKFYPNQIKFLSLIVKSKSDNNNNHNNNDNNNLISTQICCGSLPDKFHTDFNDMCNEATNIYISNFQNNTTWL
jgi:hypothetical protein